MKPSNCGKLAPEPEGRNDSSERRQNPDLEEPGVFFGETQMSQENVLTVDNSNVNSLGGKYVTVIAELERGNYCAETMLEINVGNPACYSNSVREIVVDIYPDDEQLEMIVDALDRGAISLKSLEKLGSSYGGQTVIDLGKVEKQTQEAIMSM